MKDEEIVSLFWQRKESALQETETKYHAYLTKIAHNILHDSEDAREVVSDVYWNAWNSIPPHKPAFLSAYLAKLTRRSAIDLYRKQHREKRGSGEYALSLTELQECIPAADQTTQEADLNALAAHINAFLRTLPPQQRNVFIGRYFYADSLSEVAAYYRMSIPKTKSMLHRTRQALKTYLKKEGYFHDQ